MPKRSWPTQNELHVVLLSICFVAFFFFHFILSFFFFFVLLVVLIFIFFCFVLFSRDKEHEVWCVGKQGESGIVKHDQNISYNENVNKSNFDQTAQSLLIYLIDFLLTGGTSSFQPRALVDEYAL